MTVLRDADATSEPSTKNRAWVPLMTRSRSWRCRRRPAAGRARCRPQRNEGAGANFGRRLQKERPREIAAFLFVQTRLEHLPRFAWNTRKRLRSVLQTRKRRSDCLASTRTCATLPTAKAADNRGLRCILKFERVMVPHARWCNHQQSALLPVLVFAPAWLMDNAPQPSLAWSDPEPGVAVRVNVVAVAAMPTL